MNNWRAYQMRLFFSFSFFYTLKKIQIPSPLPLPLHTDSSPHPSNPKEMHPTLWKVQDSPSLLRLGWAVFTSKENRILGRVLKTRHDWSHPFECLVPSPESQRQYTLRNVLILSRVTVSWANLQVYLVFPNWSCFFSYQSCSAHSLENMKMTQRFKLDS